MRASKSLQMTIQGHVEEYNPDRCYTFGTPVVSEGAVYISGGYLTRVSPQDRWGQVPFVEMGMGCHVALMFPLHTLAFNLNVCWKNGMAEIGDFCCVEVRNHSYLRLGIC